jgi:beta-glucosidase
MTANPLLQSLVVDQWGFRGILDTDRGAVMNMVTQHKYYPDLDHAVAGAIHAGINQFLDSYQPAIQDALQKKLITESDIDKNLRGVIHDLIKLGLLDSPRANPYSGIKNQAVAPWDTQKSKDVALRATRESIVLLKNAAAPDTQPLLPLDRSHIKSIAIIGPRADEVDSDGYGGTPPFAVTPLQGIKAEAGHGITARYATGSEDAVALAKESDIAIVVVGNQPVCGTSFGRCPDPTEGKEAIDRKEIRLQTQQEQLLEAVYAANPRTIMVLVSSFPFTIDWAEDHVPSIVQMAHSSEEEGQALADVLFGAYDPAGRLSVTWPRSLDQLPPMMDYNLRDGRTYMYLKQKPLYPFGFGLSYTSFQYSNMRLSSATLPEHGEVSVSVSVTNSGKRDGDEIVQMYVQHLDSKVDRPIEELKGFQRISLAPGRSKALSFDLPARLLAYWNTAANRWEIEHDRVRVMLGSSSADIKAEKTLSVTP